MPTSATSGTTTKFAYGPGGPLASKVVGSGNATLFIPDLHGDVVATISSGASSLTDTAWYDPYGERTTLAGSATQLGYQGDYTDASTGAVDMTTRWYLPSLGRFTSRDVLGGDPHDPPSLNQFVYGLGSPVTYSDPTGMRQLGGGGGVVCNRRCENDVFDPDGESDSNHYWDNNFGTEPSPSPAAPPSCDSTCLSANGNRLASGLAGFRGGLGSGWPNLWPSPDFPIPAGAIGPFAADNSAGVVYTGGSGGDWLHPNVTGVRFMDPTPDYPNGYVNYGRTMEDGGWQSLDPRTGRSIGKDDPWWHKELPPGFRHPPPKDSDGGPDQHPPDQGGGGDGICACSAPPRTVVPGGSPSRSGGATGALPCPCRRGFQSLVG